MALDDSAKINLALKKIQGKAQTSNQKDVFNESLGSNVSIGAATIFGKTIPTPASSSYYTIIGETVEMLRFQVSPIAGTKDDAGLFQGFELKLPSNYEAASSNPRKDICRATAIQSKPITHQVALVLQLRLHP